MTGLAKYALMQTANRDNQMRGGADADMRRGSGSRTEMGGSEEMRWMPPYYEDAQNNKDYGESRFRDRRGREHYDNGRFAPMRNALDDDDMMEDRQTRNVRNNYGRIVDINTNYGRREIPARQIGFERVENAYMGGGHKGGRMQMGGAQGYSEGMDMETAKEWTKHMKNEDGTKGPHWTMEQVKQLVNQRKLDVDEVEFFAVLNAMYSDYCKVAKKHNVNNMDFYVDLATAWLKDEDAVEDKAMAYYECIVK